MPDRALTLAFHDASGGIASRGPGPLLSPSAARALGPSLDCLQAGIVGSAMPWPDYGSSGVVLATHCYGTNHQTVPGLDRVVFLGDSITVGTPPWLPADYYRNQLADLLASWYGLDAPGFLWRNVDPTQGQVFDEESGDFASCARWGAKAHDLRGGDNQMADCFSLGDFLDRTLVVMTIGGNDVNAIAADYESGVPLAQLIADRDAFLGEIDAALAWLKTPGRFPNGIWVVLANIYDPTDGTAELMGVCIEDRGPLDGITDLILGAQESLAAMAASYDVDLVCAREHFCGNGLNGDDPAAPCYRGAAAGNWIDATCIHPTPDGHDALADDFFATIIAAAPLPPVPVLGPAVRLLLVGALAGLTLAGGMMRP